MLDILPSLWWNRFLSLLPEEEVLELFCKLSQVSKRLYDISKIIKLNKKCSFFRNIYIPKSVSFDIIQSTMLYFAKQYNTSQKWLVYIKADIENMKLLK
jgi:hypothetical protein